MDGHNFLFLDNGYPDELLSPLFIASDDNQAQKPGAGALAYLDPIPQSVKPGDLFMTSDVPVDPALGAVATGLLTPETDTASLATPSPVCAQESSPRGLGHRSRHSSSPKVKVEEEPSAQPRRRSPKTSKKARVVDEKEETRLKKGAEAAMRHRLRKKDHEKKLADAVQASEDINTRRKAEFKAANDEAIFLIDKALDHAQLCGDSDLVPQLTTIRERIRFITTQRAQMSADSAFIKTEGLLDD